MNAFGNVVMTVAIVAVMGWVMVAQQAYQQNFAGDPGITSHSADDTSLVTSMNRATYLGKTAATVSRSGDDYQG